MSLSKGSILLVSLLAGCASVGPKQVDVAIPVTCAVDVGMDPAFVDEKSALVAAPSIEARVRLMIAGRIQRDERIKTLTDALDVCKLPSF